LEESAEFVLEKNLAVVWDLGAAVKIQVARVFHGERLIHRTDGPGQIQEHISRQGLIRARQPCDRAVNPLHRVCAGPDDDTRRHIGIVEAIGLSEAELCPAFEGMLSAAPTDVIRKSLLRVKSLAPGSESANRRESSSHDRHNSKLN